MAEVKTTTERQFDQLIAILGGNCSDIDHNLRTVTHLVTRLGFVTPICFQPLSLSIEPKRKSVRQNVPIAESYGRKLMTAPTSGVSSRRSEPPLSKGVDTLPRLRHDPDVRFRRLPALRILRLGVVVADRAGDDHVFALLPVHRSGDLVLGGELQRVDHPQSPLRRVEAMVIEPISSAFARIRLAYRPPSIGNLTLSSSTDDRNRRCRSSKR
jgi:hypothetical protein